MSASRSLIALLVGTVAFFALWIVALKPSSSSGGKGPSSQGLGTYQSAINKAHQAVATSNASNAASGNENAAHSSGGASASHPATSSAKPSTSKASTSTVSKGAGKSTTKPSASMAKAKAKAQAAANLSTVEAAVKSHKAVALLFYNPTAADDQAVKHELASVPRHKGRVVKLAIPLSEAANFTAVTQQVPLNFSPTLVLISTTGEASEIVGYSDSFEIDQRVDDALAAS